MKEKSMIALLFGILAGMVLAQSGNLSAQDRKAGPCVETQTIFRDVSRFGRKDHAADNMTRKHAELAQEGWIFSDMETSIWNSNLEGFYLTYRREVPCTQL